MLHMSKHGIMSCAGVPGVLAALVLAFLSNLFGSITHYGSGQVCDPVARWFYAMSPHCGSLAWKGFCAFENPVLEVWTHAA